MCKLHRLQGRAITCCTKRLDPVQGLGLEYARSLAAAGCRCLLLTGRSPVLPLEALAGFAAAGVAVFTMAADAGDPATWASLLRWAHERLPALQLFAHAAGVTGFDLLQVSEAVGHKTCLKEHMAHHRMLQLMARRNVEKPGKTCFRAVSPLFPQQGCLCCRSSSSPAGWKPGETWGNLGKLGFVLFPQQKCLFCPHAVHGVCTAGRSSQMLLLSARVACPPGRQAATRI